jgi:1-deoxy-D-xylulose-5-phosphate synthase
MHLPDRFIDHDKPYQQYEAAGLNAHHMVAKALDALGIAGEAGWSDRKAATAQVAGRAGFRAD